MLKKILKDLRLKEIGLPQKTNNKKKSSHVSACWSVISFLPSHMLYNSSLQTAISEMPCE